MLSSKQLPLHRDGMRSALEKVKRIHAKFKANEDALQADASRTPEWRRGQTQQLRDIAFGELGPAFADLRTMRDAIRASIEPWRSIPFALGRAKFDADDAAKDAAIRGRWAAEFALMPAPLLQMHAAVAREEKAHAVLYQCWLAGARHYGAPNWTGIDLRGVEIPEQRTALALLAECQAIPAEAELLVGEINGRKTDRLALGRRMEASLEPKVGFENEGGVLPEPEGLYVPSPNDTRPPAQRMAEARRAETEGAAA